ncbi:hypothetical protein QF034_000074 [Streptomyces africanus]|uniref:Methyltransferase n=1 Tax=Streptomyces africanus TaxID=231024 RepID=A0ABU0QEN0_9ACTN|nr:hypothetical protein [Streptomyces africanus]
MFAEFHRTLAPGGYLLWGDYVGNEHLQPTHGYGRPVSYESYLLPLDRMVDLMEQAGLVVTARLEQQPAGQMGRWDHARQMPTALQHLRLDLRASGQDVVAARGVRRLVEAVLLSKTLMD